MTFLRQLTPRILSRVSNSLRLVVSNFINCYADVLEYFEELLAKVAECNGTVVWEVLFDEHVAVAVASRRQTGCSTAGR